MSSFMNRVEDIARKKLETDQKLHLMPPDTVQRELLQELDRSFSCELPYSILIVICIPGTPLSNVQWPMPEYSPTRPLEFGHQYRRSCERTGEMAVLNPRMVCPHTSVCTFASDA